MQFCVISTSTASSCPKAAFSRSNSVVSQSVCRTRAALVTIFSRSVTRRLNAVTKAVLTSLSVTWGVWHFLPPYVWLHR